MSLGLEADSSTALFHGLHGILNLVDPPLRAPRGDVVVVLVSELKKRKRKRKKEKKRKEKKKEKRIKTQRIKITIK